MHIRFLILPLVIIALAAGCSENDVEGSLTDRLQTAFEAMRARDAVDEAGELTFPGGMLSVSLPGAETVTVVTGNEDDEEKRPMRRDHRLLSGSTGKMMAGALATRLIVDGRLDPDASIERWFGHEAWFGDLPNHDAITVRHLLHHSSGVAAYYMNPAFVEDMRALSDPTRADHDPDTYPSFETLMGYVTGQPALFPAGDRASYSENGYLLLGAILGKVLAGDDQAGEDEFRAAYYQGVQELLFEPLGITDTTPLIGRTHANLAQGYRGGHPAVSEHFDKVVGDDGALVFNLTFEFAGGGWVTTSNDLARFLRGIARGEVYDDPADRQRFVEQLTEAGPVESPGIAYGFGPALLETPYGPAMGHGGEIPGYQSESIYVQSYDFSIAMQVNSWRHHDLASYYPEIAAIVVEHLESRDIKP